MPVNAEASLKSNSSKRRSRHFSPPEWQVTKFPKPVPFTPDVYLKKIDIGTSGMRYTVIVLDEQQEVVDRYRIVITQWIYGHHDNLPFAQKHQGWQGDEMIRKFNRYEIDFREGNKKTVDRDIDLSLPRSLISNRWGRLI